VLTFFSVAVASVTRAWLFYLGLFFIVIVVAAPDGLAGFIQRHTSRLARDGWRTCRAVYLCGTAAILLWTVATVLAVQWAYAVQFGAEEGAALRVGGESSWLSFVTASPMRLGLTIFVLAALGALAALSASRAQTRLAAHVRTMRNAGGPP
jgi:branched-chain amino acid transport system permease protein